MAMVGEVESTLVHRPIDAAGSGVSVARRFVERVLGARDATVIDEVLDPHAIDHSATLVRLLPLWLAFPDLRLHVEEVASEGEVVRVESVVTGTHTGRLHGVEPTGARLEGRRTHQFRIAGGRIVACRTDADLRALAAQLGTPVTAHPRPDPSGPACVGVARRAIVQRFIEQVLNGRGFVDGPGYFVEQPTDHLRGSLASCLMLAGTPDFELRVREVGEERSTVIVLADVSGTRSERSASRSVTGRVELRVRVTQDGRFAETWMDAVAVPAPAPGQGVRSVVAV
ncbi:MAG TPA: ester cyclase [Nitriliruptorales bacterium]|nr:ester cyclase [Nitriliruptorales bacterium]